MQTMRRRLGRRTLLATIAILAFVAMNASPRAQGGVRRGGATTGGMDPVLIGTIDIHVHQGPDDKPRNMDFIEAAEYAKLKGMRGMVFKSHYDATAIHAFIVRKYVPGFEAYG